MCATVHVWSSTNNTQKSALSYTMWKFPFFRGSNNQAITILVPLKRPPTYGKMFSNSAKYSVAQAVGLGGSIPRRLNSQLLLSQCDIEMGGRSSTARKEGKRGSCRVRERKQDVSVWGRWFPSASDLPACHAHCPVSHHSFRSQPSRISSCRETLQTILGQCNVNIRDGNTYSRVRTLRSFRLTHRTLPVSSGKQVEQSLSCFQRVLVR